MKLKLKAGTTSRIIRIRVKDISGNDMTGLVYNTSGLTCYYSRVGDSSATQISLVTATVGTYTSSGFVAVDGTNMPGIYELHLPNACLAAGATAVHIYLKGATGMYPVAIEIELDQIDYQQTIPSQVWDAPMSGYTGNGTFGSGFGQYAQTIYYADVELVPNSNSNDDEYGVQWFRNAIPVNSGQITNPAFSVFNALTGTALFQNRTLNYTSTVLGSLYKVVSELTTSGVPYLVTTSGTIDSQTRVWNNVVGKV